MAVVAAAAVVPALGLGTGIVGAAVGVGIYAAAGYIDSRYVIPALTGKGRQQGLPNRLLGLPVDSNEAGAPRVWALGRRVRVPTHILWQSEKRRETTSSRRKAGTTVTQRQVLITAMVGLNDRQTFRMDQLVGNGTLLLFQTRNLINVTSSTMSATEAGGVLTIAAESDADQDFTDRFAVGDFIYLRGWVGTFSERINSGALQITAVTAHSAAASSTITAIPASGQTIDDVDCTAGTSASPAVVERVDDRLIGEDWVAVSQPAWPSTPVFSAPARISVDTDPTRVLSAGDLVRLHLFTDGGFLPPGYDYAERIIDAKVERMGTTSSVGLPFYVDIEVPSAITGPFYGNFPVGGALAFDFFEFSSQQVTTPGFFPTDYVSEDNYYDGAEDQGEHPLITAALGTGNVSAYRGVALIGLEDFNVSKFGDQMPFQLEGLLSIDLDMTWQEALILCCERGGVAREFVDTEGVTPAPFEGYFMRGPVTGVSNMFPLLLAGQITTQERDGVICFQDTDAADVVQIENGALFSDFGAFVGKPDSDVDKVRFAHAAREDLPTSIGIRHQDPDNQYADGYQHFGLRGPSAADHENRQELDLSNLVLTRKQARNLATTYMRRSWINSTSVEFTLPAAYCDLLEGDLMTFTDDDDRDFTLRVIQRDIGTNFLVKVVGVLEELDIAVTGSPVQSAAGQAPPGIPQPAQIVAAVLDIAPLNDAEGTEPTLYLAACGTQGSSWAGVSVFRSVDSEATWTLAGTIGQECVMGTTLSELPAFQPAETYGSTTITWQDAVANTGVIGVEFDNLDSPFPYVTYTENDVVLDRYNWFAITDPDGVVTEIVGARDIVQVSGNTYALYQIARGLRGTWRAASSARPIGSRIVGITDLAFGLAGLKVPFPGYTTPRTVSFRFVPPGKDLADVQSVSVVADWRSASPFDLRLLGKTIDGAYDATLSTAHWTRKNLPLGSTGPYPIDESFEEYVFTIYSPTGTQIRRTKTITSRGTGSPTIRDRFVVYTASEQTTDGYTPGPSATFVVDVQQVGDYGRSRSVKQTV